MIIQSQEDVTPAVLEAYSRIEDPRLREVVSALVKHLHAFAREVHLTEEEFQAAMQTIARLGQMTTDTHNEVVLMAGSLGFSSLIPEAAERVGTVGPVPPGGTGERPDLWFTVH